VRGGGLSGLGRFRIRQYQAEYDALDRAQRGAALVEHPDQVVVDEILVGAGRAPNVEGLGLESVGVAFDAKRGVQVDDQLRTTNRRIFAVGDVAMDWKFTHAADAAAKIVVQNALFFRRLRLSETRRSHPLARGGLTLADFSGDGRRDIAVASPGESLIYVFLNRGAREFEPPSLLRSWFCWICIMTMEPAPPPYQADLHS
jgi:hypothetical protein